MASKSFYIKNKITNKSRYFQWIHNVKTILSDNGYSGIWDTHNFFNKVWLSKALKLRLMDLFLGDWYNSVQSNLNYRIFKHNFEFETYLSIVPQNWLYFLISFRTRNHRLLAEVGRWSKTDYAERKCNLCQTEIVDEFHFLLVCEKLKKLRK